MVVRLNGRAHDVPEGAALADLLAALGIDPAAVATAVNGHFVARERRPAHALQPGDEITCIQPIVGG